MVDAGGAAACACRGRNPRRCEEAGLAAPSYGAVDRRIPSLFIPEEIAKKRSANPKHLLRLKPRPGYIRASKPLEACQIDHTPTDIHFVEVVEGEGVFVGRAYLTLVADVATRSILGFCLTLKSRRRRARHRASLADVRAAAAARHRLRERVQRPRFPARLRGLWHPHSLPRSWSCP